MNKEYLTSAIALFKEAYNCYKNLEIVQGEAFGMLGIALTLICDKSKCVHIYLFRSQRVSRHT